MKYIKILSLIFIGAFIFNACSEQDFDEPPYEELGDDPIIDGDIKSLAEIKALSPNGDNVEITEDWFVQAIVISDDNTGNFYKVIYLQDENGVGGIQIVVDATELHSTYQLYRRVFVNLKGLWIGKSNAAWTIGTTPEDDRISRIPQALIEKYLLPGKYNIPFSPTEVSINEIDEDLHGNTLIKIVDVEFSDASLNESFSNEVVSSQGARNHDIQDCNGNSIILRNSDYAEFKLEIVPSGNGTITAVYSVYESFELFHQLFIRNTSDVDFTGDRCDGGSGPGDEDLIDIMDLRTMFSDGTNAVPSNKKIKGVVISDQSNGNAPHSQNIVIQGFTGGIEVRFTSDHSFNLNDELEISISGAELAEFLGALQINNVSLSAAKKLGVGSVTPKKVNIADMVSNNWDWQGTLVEIENVTVESGVFNDGSNGNKNIEDGSGSNTILRTGATASFASENIPSDEVTIVGIVSTFNGEAQIKMRRRSDMTGGGSSGGDDLLKEEFEAGFGDWVLFSGKGDQGWEIVSFGNPGNCAKMSGFSDTSNENEDWLISPVVDLSTVSTATLSFENAMNYTGNDMEVFISKNYSGSGDPSNATWDSISYNKSAGSWEWTASGAIDLSSYIGNSVHVAFKYTSTSGESAAWEVDNVIIK